MSKKYFALFLVFVIVLSGFAACIKSNPGIVITGSDGKTRVLATNDNGETMTDDAGNLIIAVTDKNGKGARDKEGNYETQRVAPPDYYVLENFIESPKFSVPVPAGWEQSTTSNIRLTHTATKGEINLYIEDGQTLTQVSDAVQEFMDMTATKDPNAEFKVETVKICGVSATRYLYSSTQFSAEMAVYVFEKNGTSFQFQTVIAKENKDIVDFESVINTIKFK